MGLCCPHIHFLPHIPEGLPGHFWKLPALRQSFMATVWVLRPTQGRLRTLELPLFSQGWAAAASGAPSWLLSDGSRPLPSAAPSFCGEAPRSEGPGDSGARSKRGLVTSDEKEAKPFIKCIDRVNRYSQRTSCVQGPILSAGDKTQRPSTLAELTV